MDACAFACFDHVFILDWFVFKLRNRVCMRMCMRWTLQTKPSQRDPASAITFARIAGLRLRF